MKRYSQLSASQKSNFRSYCVAYRFAMYGSSGLIGYTPMRVDGIMIDMPLHEFEFERPYRLGDIYGKNGSKRKN